MSDRILIVDDDLDLQRLVERQLIAAGFEPILAGDGATARAVLQREGHGLRAVVLDLDLPDTTGQELLRELQRARVDLPVVVLTASARGVSSVLIEHPAATASGTATAASDRASPRVSTSMAPLLAL